MIDAQLPGQWNLSSTSITVNDTTKGKIFVDESQPVVLAAISGEVPLPGENAVRQRILTGGQRVVEAGFSSTDGTARSLKIYQGEIATRGANTGTISITGTNVINRTTGSFITDGWRAGDVVMPFDSATAANNGVQGVITAVSALSLTCSGAPFTNDASMGAPTRFAKVSLRTQKGIPLNSGNADAAPPVPLFGGTQDPASLPPPDTGLSLDANAVLIFAAVANISALPAYISAYSISVLY